MSVINYNNASYLLSAAEISQAPKDLGLEVAFIGRSNAGKSSAINAITNIKNLARTSKTPGRTQLINFFSLTNELRLVDLPGYGYAKVPLATKERWEKLVNQYLAERTSLRGLIVVMDIRHPLKESDQMLLRWAVTCNVSVHVLLTKCDKLNRGTAKSVMVEVKERLQRFSDRITVQLFSSHDKTGLEEAHALLDQWLTMETPNEQSSSNYSR